MTTKQCKHSKITLSMLSLEDRDVCAKILPPGFNILPISSSNCSEKKSRAFETETMTSTEAEPIGNFPPVTKPIPTSIINKINTKVYFYFKNIFLVVLILYFNAISFSAFQLYPCINNTIGKKNRRKN